MEITKGIFETIPAENYGENYWECKVYVTDDHGQKWLHAKAQGFTQQEAESNAKLIASAPELLEALQTLIDKCDIMPNSKCDWDKENPYGKALQAIKKATE